MRVLICGNIVWNDPKPIFDTMYGYAQLISPQKLTFISGMAPGADYIAYVLTHAISGATCDEYPWNEEGRNKARAVAAAMGREFDDKSSRNQWMGDSGVDVCHAYAEDLPGQWSGTRDMVNICLEKGNVPIFWHNGTSVFEVISDRRWASGDKKDHMVVVETTLEEALKAGLGG